MYIHIYVCVYIHISMYRCRGFVQDLGYTLPTVNIKIHKGLRKDRHHFRKGPTGASVSGWERGGGI